MQNGITNYFYTIWAKKYTHTSLCIIVHLCIIATVTVYICTVIVACVFIILLISVHTFFSLSSPCTTNELNFPLLIFFFLKCTQTHPHPHTNTSTHRDAQIHPHTNKPTWTNQQRDRSELVGLDRCLTGAHLDRCLWNDRNSWVFCLNGAWLRWVLLDRS